jgi:hypothetical protein
MNKNYLNKVIDQLVDETILDFIILKIYLPFSTFNSISLKPNHFSKHSRLFYGFYSHCRDIYGLAPVEVEYAWDKYRHIIMDKIFQSTPLNESTGNKFLSKVVEQLVSETNIDYGRETVFAPSLLSSFPFPFFSSFSFSPSILFFDHCRDMYGLTRKETIYVWKQYKSIIEDKIKNKNP